MSKFTSYLTGLFAFLFFIQMAPSILKNIKKEYSNLFESQIKIAKLHLNDAISDADKHTKLLKEYFENKDIKGILLKIESPGGGAGACSAIFQEIQTLKKENPKPVVALTNNCCASGGYYIACTADYIVSSPAALIGSIGAHIGFFKVKDLLSKYNISHQDVYSGSYKTVGSPFTDISKENNAWLQKLSDDTYQQFTNDVANSRKLSLKDIDKWAGGKIFTGVMAKKLKLVDEVGSEYNAIKKIRELALIKKEEKIDWVEKEKPTAISKLLEGNVQSNSASNIADQVINKLVSGFIWSN